MPYISLQTNVDLSTEQQATLMTNLSTSCAEWLAKPERTVMIALQSNTPLMFAGNAKPAAYVTLKSIGLAEETAPRLSAALCSWLSNELGIAEDRIYIEFINVKRSLWGWNGQTF